MLGEQNDLTDTSIKVQDSAQETITEQSIQELKDIIQENNADTFICHWENCDHQFLTLRDLALHVNNSHIAALPWNTRY